MWPSGGSISDALILGAAAPPPEHKKSSRAMILQSLLCGPTHRTSCPPPLFNIMSLLAPLSGGALQPGRRPQQPVSPAASPAASLAAADRSPEDCSGRPRVRAGPGRPARVFASARTTPPPLRPPDHAFRVARHLHSPGAGPDALRRNRAAVPARIPQPVPGHRPAARRDDQVTTGSWGRAPERQTGLGSPPPDGAAGAPPT